MSNLLIVILVFVAMFIFAYFANKKTEESYTTTSANPDDLPEYQEIEYSFGGTTNLEQYAIQKGGYSPTNRGLDELCTHYARSRLFLIGLMNSRSKALAQRWLNTTEFQEERARFLKYQTGLNPETKEREISPEGKKSEGYFDFSYRLFDAGMLQTIHRPMMGVDERAPHCNICPEGFQILTTTPLHGINRETNIRQTVQPGFYKCRTKGRTYSDDNTSAESFLLFDGQSTMDVFVPGSEIWRACRNGQALIVAITIYDLPTHILGGETMNWCKDWESVKQISNVRGFDNPRQYAKIYADDCIKGLKLLPVPAFRYLAAAWLFSPQNGIFPDKKIHEQYLLQFT